MRKYNKKQILYYIIGLAVSVIPVFAAVISYFPLWHERGGEYVLSGFALILLVLSVIPLIRIFKEKLKSPSSYFVWLLIFVLFFSLSKIADEMTVISFIGFLSNLIGAVFFNISRHFGEEK